MIAIYKWVTKKNNWGDNRFFEQKNNTKKINPIFKQKARNDFKARNHNLDPKIRIWARAPHFLRKKYKTSVITCFEFKSKILKESIKSTSYTVNRLENPNSWHLQTQKTKFLPKTSIFIGPKTNYLEI